MTDGTPYMVMLVLNKVDQLDTVLDAWRRVGVPGATILESTGLYARERHRHVAARFPFAQGSSLDAQSGQITVLAAVCDLDLADRCLAAAESVLGDLNAPNTGIFVSWPLVHAKGINRGADCSEAGA